MAYTGDMPRNTLTREQIVRAAIELLDAEGVEGLSMRCLGNRLGSAATAVYWHVKSKDALVVLAGDAVWGEIALPDLSAVGWRTAATRMANDTYAMVIRHLWLVPAMSTHLIYGPGKARYDDHSLAVYEAAGVTGVTGGDADWALTALHSVFTFVLGMALGEAAEVAWRTRLRHEGGNEEEQMRDALAQASAIAMQFPRLRTRIEAGGSADLAAPPDQSFAFGLQALLDGLEAQLAARPRPA